MNNLLKQEKLFIATIDSKYIRDAQLIPYEDLTVQDIIDYNNDSKEYENIFYNKTWYDIEVNHFLGAIYAPDKEEALEKIAKISMYPKEIIKILNTNSIE